MRLIDADKFVEWLDVGHLRSPSEICYSERDVKVMIDAQPTIDAVPVVHGEWVYRYGSAWECSNCKSMIHLSDDTNAHPNYCPQCGAKMDGGAE